MEGTEHQRALVARIGLRCAHLQSMKLYPFSCELLNAPEPAKHVERFHRALSRHGCTSVFREPREIAAKWYATAAEIERIGG